MTHIRTRTLLLLLLLLLVLLTCALSLTYALTCYKIRRGFIYKTLSSKMGVRVRLRMLKIWGRFLVVSLTDLLSSNSLNPVTLSPPRLAAFILVMEVAATTRQ